MGSLTGAVASQIVTEALKGSLRLVGNQSTAKAGHSDQAVEYGIAVA